MIRVIAHAAYVTVNYALFMKVFDTFCCIYKLYKDNITDRTLSSHKRFLPIEGCESKGSGVYLLQPTYLT